MENGAFLKGHLHMAKTIHLRTGPQISYNFLLINPGFYTSSGEKTCLYSFYKYMLRRYIEDDFVLGS